MSSHIITCRIVTICDLQSSLLCVIFCFSKAFKNVGKSGHVLNLTGRSWVRNIYIHFKSWTWNWCWLTLNVGSGKPQVQCVSLNTKKTNHFRQSSRRHSGPYFNGLKRSAKAWNVETVVGGSMAMLLLWRRINYFCARRKSKKGWSEGASLPVGQCLIETELQHSCCPPL